MLINIFRRFISFFDTRSEYEKQEDDRIIESIRNGPKSLRVSSRGVVSVDPKEIYNSPKFQEELKQASKLVNKNVNI